MSLTDKKTLASAVWIPQTVFASNDSRYIGQIVYERLIADLDEADTDVAEDFLAIAEPTMEVEFIDAIERSVNTSDKLGCELGNYRVEIQRHSVPASSDGLKRPHECFDILMYLLD